MLDPDTQAGLEAEKFKPLPNDVIDYIRNRALPLLITDPKYPEVGIMLASLLHFCILCSICNTSFEGSIC